MAIKTKNPLYYLLKLFLAITIIAFLIQDFYSQSDYSRKLQIERAPSQNDRRFVILANITNNVCYINCIIQSLLSFKEYFNGYEGRMAGIIQSIYKKVDSAQQFTINLLSSYREILDTLDINSFDVYRPGDAMELLHFMLNDTVVYYLKKRKIKIHNRFYVHKKNYKDLLKIPIIRDFCTILEFQNSDYIWFMPVIVLRFENHFVQPLLDDFFKIFIKKSRFAQSNRFLHVPDVLIVSFWKKLGCLKSINLAKQEFIVLSNVEYRLNSLIIYAMKDNIGHYFSCSLVKDQWFLFDEDKITKIDLETFDNGFVAVALYEKIGKNYISG